MLSASQNDKEGAKREYEKAAKLTAGGQPNIAPLLGLATIAFNQGRYAISLAMCASPVGHLESGRMCHNGMALRARWHCSWP